MIATLRCAVAAAWLLCAADIAHAGAQLNRSVSQSVPSAAENGPAVLPDVALARLLLEQHYPEAACKLLHKTTPADSDNADRLYLLARCSVELKQYDAAVAYYAKVIKLVPNAPRPRAELATLFMAAGHPAEASRLFSDASRLSHSIDDAGLMGALAEQLGANDPAAVAPRHAAKPWSIEVYAGVLHDDNVNGGPLSNVVPAIIGTTPIDFTLSPEAMPRSSYAAVGSITGKYLVPLNPNWSLLLQGSLAGTGYFSESDFSNDSLTLAAAFIYRDRDISASVQPNLIYQRRDHHMQEATPGIVGRVSKMLSQTVQATASASHQQRSVQVDRDRDATIWSGSAGLVMQASTRLQLGVEYEVQDENADENIYSNKSYGPNLFATYLFSPTATVIGNLGYADVHYDEKMALFAEPREDTRKTAALTLLWDVSNWAGRNLVVRAQYMHVRNPSNIAYNDYKRNLISVGVQTQF